MENAFCCYKYACISLQICVFGDWGGEEKRGKEHEGLERECGCIG